MTVCRHCDATASQTALRHVSLNIAFVPNLRFDFVMAEIVLALGVATLSPAICPTLRFRIGRQILKLGQMIGSIMVNPKTRTGARLVIVAPDPSHDTLILRHSHY